MSFQNPNPKGWVDVFHAYLLEDAYYDSLYDIPILKPEYEIPRRLIPFSKSLKSQDFDAHVHFYEHDVKIERVWNRPRYYTKYLRQFSGVIAPDFSIYRNMPFAMQIWNTFRSRALGHWWQMLGLTVIPNIRWGDEPTFDICCAGIEKGSVIAIGSYGNLRDLEDRYYFQLGLEYVVNKIAPPVIIVYGSAPDDIFQPYKDMGIQLVTFESEFALTHKRAKE